MSNTEETVRQVTKELRGDVLWDFMSKTDESDFRPVPAKKTDGPCWRVRIELTHNTRQSLGLALYDEVILGRGDDNDNFVSLDDFDAAELGVSREHIGLRPTASKLYVVDRGSTNGTTVNGRSIGVNTPYKLSNGDLLALGRMELFVHIVQRPLNKTTGLQDIHSLTEALVPIAKAVLGQFHIDEVLVQALEVTRALTGVEEAAIWLVDERTGELFLEAGQGVETDKLRDARLCINETMAGKVIETGQPVRANREAGADPIKVKTGYLVEAVMYVPLTLGGITFGVLSAAHHKPGGRIDQDAEQIMTTIASLTALAVQNARHFEATATAVTRHHKLLTAMGFVLSHQVKDALNAVIGYAGLLGLDTNLDDYSLDTVDHIMQSGQYVSGVIERLLEIVRLSESPLPRQVPCDLVDEVTRVMDDARGYGDERNTEVEFQVVGEPFLITGDPGYLSRAVRNLVENAIEHTPPGSHVNVVLVFTSKEIIIQVRDNGPGIPEDEIPHLFDRYFRQGTTYDKMDHHLGLGLEMTRILVEAHQGTITSRHPEDGGMEFIISLPGTSQVV